MTTFNGCFISALGGMLIGVALVLLTRDGFSTPGVVTAIMGYLYIGIGFAMGHR